MSDEDNTAGNAVQVRWPELLVALLLMGIATLVIVDSVRVGTGWGDDGPRSGYFPFYIGLALLLSSGWTALKQLMRWRRVEHFAERAQMRSVLAVLLPMVVYVGAISQIGIYVSSALLIGWFMLRHGKHPIAMTAGIALAVPLAFFLVFERWFLVPLPKGPLEALLGF